MSARPPNPLRRTFGVPLLIAVASLIGLVSALLGDAHEDWISWAGLSAPLIAIGWASLARRT